MISQLFNRAQNVALVENRVQVHTCTLLFDGLYDVGKTV